MTRRVLLVLTAFAPLAFGVATLRHTVESSMFLHMMVQFPMLLASGMASAALVATASAAWDRVWSIFDHEGLLGLVTLSAVAALWMVPAALDAALIQPATAGLKYVTWWFAGFALTLSWPRMSGALRMFLLGGLAWMFATAGLLFWESDMRLCVSYRVDEQSATGAALLGLSGLLVIGLVGNVCRRDR